MEELPPLSPGMDYSLPHPEAEAEAEGHGRKRPREDEDDDIDARADVRSKLADQEAPVAPTGVLVWPFLSFWAPPWLQLLEQIEEQSNWVDATPCPFSEERNRVKSSQIDCSDACTVRQVLAQHSRALCVCLCRKINFFSGFQALGLNV